MKTNGENSQPESLKDDVENVEQESRMVLPGIQALFGFQLIAVFNQRFTELNFTEKYLHLAALLCIVAATIFAMTPASYHRLVEPGQISRRLVKIGTCFLSRAMFFLMLGTVLDVYVVTKIVGDDSRFAVVIALGTLFLFVHFWYTYPLQEKKKR